MVQPCDQQFKQDMKNTWGDHWTENVNYLTRFFWCNFCKVTEISAVSQLVTNVDINPNLQILI